jgi:hypothetical protein
MKKIILSVAVLAVAGFTAVKANTVNSKAHTVTIVVQKDSTLKTPVNLADLPAPVKTTLQGDVLKAWTPTDAFLVKSGSAEYYQIDIKKEADTKFIRIDKDGKLIQ